MDISKYTDRMCLKWINQPKLKGWQFSFERPELPESKFFNIKKHDGVDGAYSAAIKYRDGFLEAATELGIYDENASRNKLLPLNIKLSPRNTSGIVGVCRSVSQRKDRENSEITWRAGFQNAKGQNRQKGYSVQGLGEKTAFYEAIKYRRNFLLSVYDSLENDHAKEVLERHIEEFDAILEYASELVDDSDVFFFLGALNNPYLESTSKKEMLDIRVGQYRFRKLVMSYWENKCAVTGTKHFLTAGHIKPWRDADNAERLDVFNGLSLSPVYDKAFDKGLISFENDGKIIISKKLDAEAPLLGIKPEDKLRGKLNFLHHKYLTWHREKILAK
jgi:hypothetical protein